MKVLKYSWVTYLSYPPFSATDSYSLLSGSWQPCWAGTWGQTHPWPQLPAIRASSRTAQIWSCRVLLCWPSGFCSNRLRAELGLSDAGPSSISGFKGPIVRLGGTQGTDWESSITSSASPLTAFAVRGGPYLRARLAFVLVSGGLSRVLVWRRTSLASRTFSQI